MHSGTSLTRSGTFTIPIQVAGWYLVLIVFYNTGTYVLYRKLGVTLLVFYCTVYTIPKQVALWWYLVLLVFYNINTGFIGNLAGFIGKFSRVHWQ